MSIKTKLLWKQRQNELVELVLNSLCESYPNTFFPNHSSETKPLKLGIFSDIYREREDIGGRVLKSALGRYTNQDRYLRALISHANRVDLTGNTSSTIADHHRQFAIDALIRRQKKNLASSGRAA